MRPPSTGSPGSFERQAGPGGPDFARVALLLNLSGHGFVLLIAGFEA
jgi:hypothetical protein